MTPNTTALERAFSLAESGKYSTVQHIRDTLRREGYDVQQLTGKSLIKQLREIIRRT
ncbi:hypothetical protein [Mesorhizobium hawassense]|uniref:hypothetical protein n=1 Tax=Mesorhizobium hawassense TaxID=1209954 RepID=UPI00142E6EDE|nr:hypothetical protein [Mesorhizobium hawassense]